MANRLLTALMAFGAIILIISLIVTQVSTDSGTIYKAWTMFGFGLNIGGLFGLIMLFINGTFIRSRYFRFVMISSSFIVIGAICKIESWPYSTQVFIIGYIGILLSYFLSFLEKQNKKRLDYMKLSWVILSYSVYIFKLLDILKGDYKNVLTFLLWLIIIDFLIEGFLRRTLFIK